MTFPKQFTQDLDEAYDYWLAAQLQAGKAPATTSKTQWVMALLRQPVYALISEKRTRAEEINDAEVGH